MSDLTQQRYAGLLERTGHIVLDAAYELDSAIDREKETAGELSAATNALDKYRTEVWRTIGFLNNLIEDLQGNAREVALERRNALQQSLHIQELPF